MRIALLADIHGNWEAMTAAISSARAMGATRFGFMGDLVGYGPDPAAVTERAMELVAAGGFAVLGNHDEGIEKPDPHMNGLALSALDWTRDNLSPSHRAFLASLPMRHVEEDVLFTHASPARAGQWPYILDASDAADGFSASPARLIFVGHTHRPALYHTPDGRVPQLFRPLDNKPVPFSRLRRYLTVLGAVGQPRDGNPAACYGLFERDIGAITMVRVAYDVESTMRKIRDAGLPDKLATRLIAGK